MVAQMINQIEAIIINKGTRYKDFVIAFILIIAALITGSYFMVAGVSGVYLDDGIYVSTAKSIASDQGYRLINLPGAPCQTKYPPLYPLILAGLWKIWPDFPSNLLAMQWVTLFMAAMSVGLSYYYVSVYGYATREIALLAGLLTVTSHYFLYYSTLTLSEMPFAFFLCLALLAFERFVGNASDRAYNKILLAVILTLPFLTRSIGIVLIPVALILLFFKSSPGLVNCNWLCFHRFGMDCLDQFTASDRTTGN